MQQSKKLQEENERGRPDQTMGGLEAAPTEGGDAAPVVTGPIQIRPIVMYNDWVAILQDHIEVKHGVLVKQEELAQPEGIVVGVNAQGLPDGAGGRVPPQVALGDRVAFQARSILQGFTPENPDSPYHGKKIVVVSERNIVFKLPTPVEFEIID